MPGRKALVIGGTGGIGQAVVAALTEVGWHVTAHTTARRHVQPIAAETIIGRLDSPSTIESFGQAVLTAYKSTKLDLMVYCAGVHTLSPTAGPGLHGEMMFVNTVAPYYITKQIVPLLRGDGRVVLISSVSAQRAFPGDEFYGATKAGVNALVRGLAFSLGRHGVRVFAISPGLIETNMTKELFSDRSLVEKLSKRSPSGRLGQPDDIARVVISLASGNMDWCTGTIILSDGGYSLGDWS